MKRIILVTALLLAGGAAAQADTDHFTNMRIPVVTMCFTPTQRTARS